MEGANFSSPLESERKPLRMEVKMMSMDLTDRSGAHTMLKCRNSRGVTLLRPPPGGAQQAMNTQSDTSMNRNFLRSQKPPWSMIWRSSSLGGCAPYRSRAGMLMSSTKNTMRFPPRGPISVLLFLVNLSLSRQTSSRFLVLVWAEKFMTVQLNLSSSIWPRKSATMTDLPTPVSPERRMFLRLWRSLLMRYLQRTVSPVGTRMLKQGTSGSYLYSVTSSDQLWNSFLSKSMKQSQISPSQGKEEQNLRILFLMVWLNLMRELSLSESQRLAPADHTNAKISTMEQQASASKLLILSRFCRAVSSPYRMLKMLMQLCTRLLSALTITSLHSSRSQARFSRNSVFIFSMTLTTQGGTTFSRFRSSLKPTDQVSMMGSQPRWMGSRQTMPQRLTVAGDATARSLTSNIMVKEAGSLMRWPLLRQSILLSSRTVFMFSIQRASTGPSKMIHFLVSEVSATLVRTMAATMPSVHSLVRTLVQPKSSFMVTDLGLRRSCLTTLWQQSVEPSLCSCSQDLASVSMTVVLPVPVSPTIITPCRTMIVSISWMIFVRYFLGFWQLRTYSWCSIARCRLPQSMFGISTRGNRSAMIPMNSGRSCSRNFGTFESLIARISTTSSGSFASLRRSAPAITSTLFTARIPKSQWSCFDSCSEDSLYSCTILRASDLAVSKPSEKRMISAMRAQSGIIMATGRKSALRLSGSSVLPAQPGFMVMKTPKRRLRGMMRVSNSNSVSSRLMACWMVRICWAMTESTSMSMRLNSSKHDHAPPCASPLKKRPIVLQSRPSEQLNTTHCTASAFARSLVVSVFPVPAGPAGAPPNWRCLAEVRVMQHLSVRGVMTSRGPFPRYSQPYLKLVLVCLTKQSSSSGSQQQRSCLLNSKSLRFLTPFSTSSVTTSRAWTSRTMSAPMSMRWRVLRSLRTMATMRVIMSFMKASQARTPCLGLRSSLRTACVTPSLHLIWSTSRMFCALQANSHFSRFSGSSSGYSRSACFAMSYSDFTIISWIFISQFSTGPSENTLAEKRTVSGMVSGSAEVMEMISRDSSTSVNSILLMLSKHLRRWGWTACGLRVCERISRSSSLERKQKRGNAPRLTSRQSSIFFWISSSSLLFFWNLRRSSSEAQQSQTRGRLKVLTMMSFQNLSTTTNFLFSSGSCFWMSSALKMFSRYIHWRWQVSHSSMISEMSRSRFSMISTLSLISATYREPIIDWILSWWSSRVCMISSTEPMMNLSLASRQLLTMKLSAPHFCWISSICVSIWCSPVARAEISSMASLRSMMPKESSSVRLTDLPATMGCSSLSQIFFQCLSLRSLLATETMMGMRAVMLRMRASWASRTRSRPSLERLEMRILSWKTVSSNCWTSRWMSSESKLRMLDFSQVSCSLMNRSTCVQSSFRSLNFTSTSCSSLFGLGEIPISFCTFTYASFFSFCLRMFFSTASSSRSASEGGQFSSMSLSRMRVASMFLMLRERILMLSLMLSSMARRFLSMTSCAFLSSFWRLAYFSLRSWSSPVWSRLMLPSSFLSWLCMLSISIFWFSRALLRPMIMLKFSMYSPYSLRSSGQGSRLLVKRSMVSLVSFMRRTMREESSLRQMSILDSSSEVSLLAILMPLMLRQPLAMSLMRALMKLFHSVNLWIFCLISSKVTLPSSQLGIWKELRKLKICRTCWQFSSMQSPATRKSRRIFSSIQLRTRLNSTDCVTISPMSGSFSCFSSDPRRISAGMRWTPLTTSIMFLRVLSMFSRSSSSLGSKVMCSSLMAILKRPVLRSFFISSRRMSMDWWLMLTRVSIMTQSTRRTKLGRRSRSRLAIWRRQAFSSSSRRLRFMGFCLTCCPNFISSWSSTSLRLHFSQISFWTLRTMTVILLAMMLSYCALAILRVWSCSQLKSPFSQVLLSLILEKMVLFCWRSKRQRLTSMRFSAKVGLEMKASETSRCRILRKERQRTFFFQMLKILVMVQLLKKPMLVMMLKRVDSCIQSESPTTSVERSSSLPSALSCFFMRSEQTLTMPCAEMVQYSSKADSFWLSLPAMTSRSQGRNCSALSFWMQLINLMGVVLPYFAKKEMATSPVLIVFRMLLTDLSTNNAFWILFCGFWLSPRQSPLTMSVQLGRPGTSSSSPSCSALLCASLCSKREETLEAAMSFCGCAGRSSWWAKGRLQSWSSCLMSNLQSWLQMEQSVFLATERKGLVEFLRRCSCSFFCFSSSLNQLTATLRPASTTCQPVLASSQVINLIQISPIAHPNVQTPTPYTASLRPTLIPAISLN